jgi:hypothetical protein
VSSPSSPSLDDDLAGTIASFDGVSDKLVIDLSGGRPDERPGLRFTWVEAGNAGDCAAS